MRSIFTLGEFAGALGVPPGALQDFLKLLNDQDAFEKAKADAQVQAWAPGRHQTRALRDGRESFGHISHVVPAAAYIRQAQANEGQSPDHAVDPEWWDWAGRRFPQVKARYVPDRCTVVSAGCPGRQVVKRYETETLKSEN